MEKTLVLLSAWPGCRRKALAGRDPDAVNGRGVPCPGGPGPCAHQEQHVIPSHGGGGTGGLSGLWRAGFWFGMWGESSCYLESESHLADFPHFLSCFSSWAPNQQHKSFLRPRLIAPYTSECPLARARSWRRQGAASVWGSLDSLHPFFSSGPGGTEGGRGAPGNPPGAAAQHAAVRQSHVFHCQL